MLIKFPSKTNNFLKLVLPFVMLFQWTMLTIEKKRNFNINFSNITFENCNDPEHSHPPLSQKETSEDLEKLFNSDLNNYFFVNSYQKYFDISVEKIFEKPERSPEFLFKHFPPARSPPYLEV